MTIQICPTPVAEPFFPAIYPEPQASLDDVTGISRQQKRTNTQYVQTHESSSTMKPHYARPSNFSPSSHISSIVWLNQVVRSTMGACPIPLTMTPLARPGPK